MKSGRPLHDSTPESRIHSVKSVWHYGFEYYLTWLDGAEVSASGWGSGGPRFQSHQRLTFQSCSRYQLNQLGSKAASESTVKKSNTCGVSNNRLYFFTLLLWKFEIICFTGQDGLSSHEVMMMMMMMMMKWWNKSIEPSSELVLRHCSLIDSTKHLSCWTSMYIV